MESDAGVYSIPCKDCKSENTDETSRNINKRLQEHKCDIRLGKLSYVLFLHISKTGHNFYFNASTILIHIHNKIWDKLLKPAISLLPSVNTRPGFFNLSPFLGKLILNC